MRKPSSLLLALGVCASLLAASSAGFAQDKTIRIGGLLPVSGPGAYFEAQDKRGIELAFDGINRSGFDGYRFAIQYEPVSPIPPQPQQAAPVRTKREARQSRTQPPQPSPKTSVRR
jgi:hypothetical protein